MKLRYKFLLIVTWFPLLYLSVTQIAYFLSFHYDLLAWSKQQKFLLPWSVVYWQGNSDYFRLSLIFSGLLTFFFLLTLFSPNKSERERRRAERRLTAEERLEYKHLSTKKETRVGLQRLNFTDEAVLNHLKEDKLQSAIGYWSMLLTLISVLAIMVGATIGTITYAVSKLKNIKTMYNIYCIPFIKIWIAFLLIGIFVFVCSFIVNVQKSLSNRQEGERFTWDYFRDYCNYCFNESKKRANKLMDFLKMNKDFRFTTLKKWNINREETYFRSGIPIETFKNKMYVDASDSHNIVVGTTNSGKTQSQINPMIMGSMMAGESMIINDIKGELMPTFYHKLKEKGYTIISVNFIDPETSSLWNPLSIVIKKYRSIEKNYEEKILSTVGTEKEAYLAYKKEYLGLIKEFNSLIHLHKLCTSTTGIIHFAKLGFKNVKPLVESAKEILIRGKPLDQQLQNMYVFEKLLDRFKEKKIQVEMKKKTSLPPIDFSEALEYLRDISNTLFLEKDSKNSFFWQQAQFLFEGIILFMLEYEYLDQDEQGEYILKKLDDNQINFRTIKLFRDEMVTTEAFFRNDEIINHFLMLKSSEDFSMQRMKGVLDQPENTRSNILGTFDTKISIGTLNESIAKMTSQSNIDFHDLGTKKTALFIGVHDEKETYYPFVSMLIKQAYEELVKTAREDIDQRLPIPLNIIWDEFGISPALKNIDNMLSAMRFRGIRMTMVIQDFSQLDEKYGKNTASSIKNNVMNTIYLLAGEKSTLEDISYKAGHRLSWNKELNRFDKVPIMPAERLSRFQYGEALILSQRKNPIYTHLREFKKYGYYKKLGKPSADLMDRKLPELNWFLLTKEWQRIQDFKF
ncbi:type IV secretory system conjugative DNA transfer family protein [Bulleidia sp. zg-1006]|uniref:type IV secretory system conjugative DNA transfer family protein n=1 Tax=Bulleidia sp. zg-1006 TaxID=2806552 RepID=UPI001A933E44|nr:type IV secretory system conjugative DNA transfer family protein [Bulleidia sp. zg-1006]